MSFSKISLDDIQKASQCLHGVVLRTPILFSRSISELLDTEVYLKLENKQVTGSFKARGAYNKISSLSDEQRKMGVIASSAGNHAQGVAFAAGKFGIQAHIVMPRHASLVKVTATESYGAQVHLMGDYYDDAYAYACQLAEEKKLVFVHPFNDPLIMAGQGTVGLELFEQISGLDSVVVPIGGGGLISGVSTALKILNPKIKIYGVVSKNASGMQYLYKGKSLSGLQTHATIADGIAVKKPNEEIFKNYIQPNVDEIISISDDEAAESIVYLLEREKTMVEGSAAVVLSAAKKLKGRLGKKSALIMSGGNIDLNLVATIIEKGLSTAGRLSRVNVITADQPGILNQLTGIISAQEANILDVKHDRLSSNLQIREARIEFLLETRNKEHIQEIKKSFQAAGVVVV